jgi:uncharacterized membrane protein YkvA (DUF1232 family)
VKVSFELSAKDIRYFRERLKLVRSSGGDGAEAEILEGAQKMLEEARAAEPPQFVLQRFVTLEQLIEMLHDADWRLEGRDRARILDALAYFVDPEDMIPDRLPGIGYLDDAIMVELIAQELKHEVKAYEDFCEFRGRRSEKQDPAKLESRRKSLQARMRRRLRRELEALRGRSRGGRSPRRIW